MVTSEEELRQLKIKTGSLTRLTKELVLYEKEHKQEQARVAAMKAGNADAHDIKHAVRSPAAQQSALCRSVCAPCSRRAACRRTCCWRQT
jgi:MoaA/NifB/PqqE/SkfB family radical SAM enzyme